jgi:hypothetical protein
LLLACNFLETKKLTPLLIGKSKAPRCFKNINSLPVTYRSNSSSWMTSVIFNQWLIDFDLSRSSTIDRTALIVDNAPCHRIFESTKLKNVDLIFLPPNATSVLQSIDQGIIHSFKSFYKKLFLQSALNKRELK